MQKLISTNIQLPEPVWKAIKVRAAQEGKSMKQIILEGVAKLLGKEVPDYSDTSKKNPLLEFAGKATSNIQNGSIHHDRYLDEK